MAIYEFVLRSEMHTKWPQAETFRQEVMEGMYPKKFEIRGCI